MIRFFPLCAACLLTAVLTACDEAPDKTETTSLRPVRVIEISEELATQQRTFSGISRSTQASRLSFKVSGNIIELPIKIGSRLSKGQLVASLDPSAFDLAVEQSQANLSQAQANLRNASTSYDRVKGLYANSNASKGELDAARAGEESARAQTSAAKKAVEIAELNRSYTRLSAGGDCSVVSINVEVNENVSTGSPIASVDCGKGIEVSLAIPESLIRHFSPGLEAAVYFNAIDDKPFAGTVTEVGGSAGGVGTTFPVVVQLSHPGEEVRSGLAAEVTFTFPTIVSENIHVVPTQALVKRRDGTYVFLAVPDRDGKTATITRKRVELGEITNDGIEVSSTLSVGDKVVVAGVSVIHDGQIVLLP